MKVKKIAVCLIGLGLFLLMCTPAFAASKSVTIRVSCTILPMMELSVPQTAAVRASGPAVTQPALPARPELWLSSADQGVIAKSNLSGNTRLNESFRQTPGGLVKLYSLTAL
jgi:hypothetical protein